MKLIPWPKEWMMNKYREGKTVQDIADLLSSDAWQPYWKKRLGTEYRPGQKIVNGVLKRWRCPMRRRGPKDGPEHKGWKGGRTIDKHGYILVYRPNHPNANSNGYIREHRLIAEQCLGRHLLPTEVVHHVDDDHANNSPDNLIVYESNGLHLSKTLAGKTPNWTEEGKRNIQAGQDKSPKAGRGTNSKPRAKVRYHLKPDGTKLTQTPDHSTE